VGLRRNEKFGCRADDLWQFGSPSSRKAISQDVSGLSGSIFNADNIMAYAIFKTGGKQYKAFVGDQLDVEKIEVAEGEGASFED
jgi:Ribosomal protein L21